MSRTAFVLDASIALAWGFEDESNAYTEKVLESLVEGEAFVPAVWPLEVGNALLMAERRKRLAHTDVVQFLTLLRGLPINVEEESPERMLGGNSCLGAGPEAIHARCLLPRPSHAAWAAAGHAGPGDAPSRGQLRREDLLSQRGLK